MFAGAKWAEGLLFVLAAVIYLSFSLPWYVDLVVLLGLGVIAVRSTWREMTLLLVSLVLAALTLEAFLPGEGAQVFYREHEKWARATSYQPRVADRIAVPHGDLTALDPGAPVSILDPRHEEFVTDSLGFRNRADYAGEPAVVVGDSFVVANGSDQKDSLPEILTHELGLPAYSLGFPSAPTDYERRAAAFLPRLAPGALYAFLIFEGNDFATDVPFRVGPNLYDRKRASALKNSVPFLRYPKALFGMSRRAERVIGRMLGLDMHESVAVHPVGPKPVGFLRPYVEAALHPHPGYAVAGDEAVLKRMGCVFFVPDKYRVYKEFIEDGRAMPEPAPGLRALEAYYGPRGVPVMDLTPPLREAARRELGAGRYVYWRDDTHWNGLGIRAVAPAVKSCLEARSRSPDSPVGFLTAPGTARP